MQIREYTSKDKDFLLAATEKLHDYVIALDPIQRLRKMPGYVSYTVTDLLNIVDKQEGRIYIAQEKTKPIGFIAGFVMKQSETNLLSVVPSKLGVISDVYVDEQYRGNHLGTDLIDKIETYLKETGCDAIWIDIVSFNQRAHHFYTKLGYIDREIGLIKKIK